MKGFAALLALVLLLDGCAQTPHSRETSSTLVGDAAHPATEHWLRTELYFGLNPATAFTDMADNERRWQDFLDHEVTPRFPDGLSVYDVYGQWRTQGHSEIERLHSKEVMILYADTTQNAANIEAIRTAWKKETGDQSVLRVTQPADVSF